MRTALAWLALLGLADGACAATACAPLEQRLSAAQLDEIGLSDHQRELLQRYLCAAADARPEARAAEPSAVPARAEATPPPADPARFIGLDSGRIDTRARGTVAGWEPGTVFELENGQRWQVLKGSLTLRAPLQDPAVVLVPGIAGRWFLQVDEDLPKARVFRID